MKKLFNKIWRFLTWFIRPPRKISFTREGIIFTVFTLPLGFAAINTGNNMLYLILGMLLSVIVLNGFLSESTVKKMAIVGKLPKCIGAGEMLSAFVELKNEKTYFPSYLLRLSHIWEAQVKQKKRARTNAEVPLVTTDESYCVKLSAGESQKVRLVSRFNARGIYKLKGYRLATLFPFGLFNKSREFEVGGQIFVYPKPVEANAQDSGPWTNAGDMEVNSRGLGGDLHALREYTSNDDARMIHWKLSAKFGRPIVREYTATGKKRVFVVFDTRREKSAPSPESNSGVSMRRDPPFEMAVSRAAYFIQEAFLAGLEFGLLTPERRFLPEAGEAQYHRIMEYLAGVDRLEATLPFSTDFLNEMDLRDGVIHLGIAPPKIAGASAKTSNVPGYLRPVP